MPSQVKTNTRNRRKPSESRPQTGVVPTITSVAPVGIGNPTYATVTFSTGVMVPRVPANWTTLGLTPNASAVSVVSNTGTSIVLDFGVDVTSMTGISVPQGNVYAMTASGKAVPPGDYLV